MDRDAMWVQFDIAGLVSGSYGDLADPLAVEGDFPVDDARVCGRCDNSGRHVVHRDSHNSPIVVRYATNNKRLA